ncbi:DUF5988 family protein [Kitasatospora sp. NPDC048545]|uniref:DUF5988 family protein n=1 Tax=Kitasatospora sp. NPDC048545 TaxID=3157208 RepID=UPI0033C4B001
MGLPECERPRFPDAGQYVVKRPRTVRYEHPRRSQRTVCHRSSEPPVFEWTGSTLVAERTWRSGRAERPRCAPGAEGDGGCRGGPLLGKRAPPAAVAVRPGG